MTERKKNILLGVMGLFLTTVFIIIGFEVFDFKMLYGKIENPLDSRESVILSEEYSKKYWSSFGFGF